MRLSSHRSFFRIFRSRQRTIMYFSLITCPDCGRRSRDQMPSNASVYFYHCLRCNVVFKPLPGDCCVYCSYGDVPCPGRQQGL